MIFKTTPPRIRQLAVIGVALSLLFLGCERDEVQEQKSSQTLTRQEAMNMFFKSYQRKEDNFRDEVVTRLLAMNDSSDIIYTLTQAFGQPRWEVEQTLSCKSENLLFVPVCAEGLDSITAIFLFEEMDNLIYLKIFDRGSSDTLVSDLLLHYQCSMFPQQEYTKRKALPSKGESKDFVNIAICYDVLTSTDGGIIWHYSYTNCRYEVVWESNVSKYLLYPADYAIDDDGGGGGGGVASNGPISTGLSPIAINKIAKTINQLILNNCPNKQVYKLTWNSSLTININSSLGSTGAHYPGVIEFRSATSISDITLLHELFHEYQDKINGVLPVTQLSEFEAWLYVDLYLWEINNEDLTWTIGLDQYSNMVLDYKDWINDIYENGFTDSNMADYTKWFTEFMKVKDSAYGKYPVGNNSNPGAIINVFNVCNY